MPDTDRRQPSPELSLDDRLKVLEFRHSVTVKRDARIIRALVLANIAFGFALVVCAIYIHANRATTRTIRTEGASRRQQTCLLFERTERKSRRDLRNAYSYLSHLSSAQRAMPLNVAIAALLPQAESDAHTSTAPGYCRANGVGLAASQIPPFPKRPRNLRTR